MVRPVAEHDRRTAAVGFLQRCDGRSGGTEVLRCDSIGGRSEHRRHGYLVAGTHLQQIRNRAEKPCAAVVSLQPRRTVLAIQADRQRLDARPQRGHLTLGAAFGRLQFGDAFVGQPQRGHRAVVVLVEADLACVEFTDAALDGLELGLHLLGLGGRVLDADRQARHGLVDRFDAGAHGVDLAGQPGQAFAPVGFGAGGGQVGAFGFGGDTFTFGEFGAGGLQPGARFGQLVEQLPLLGRDLVRPGPRGLRGPARWTFRARRRGAGRARWRCARSR